MDTRVAGYVFVVATMVIVSIVSFAMLTPLDSVGAVSSASLILGLSYAISFVLFGIVYALYTSTEDAWKNLVWLVTAIVFLVCVPTTISATAMNVVTVQNTRNLLAGRVAAT
jgi:hypothetical protein